MQPLYQAALRSWDVPPAATFALALTALVYLRGWWLLRRAGVPFVPGWRAASFMAGIFSLWVALASPMDVLNGFVLTAHMLQHIMLMMIAPPLLLLGAPVIPVLRGLPVFAAREFAGPFLNWRPAQRVGRALTHPALALLLMGASMLAWHVPALYELALRSSAWHEVEHACFFLTSLVFWWPVVQPWPSHSYWPRWAMVPYLLVGDLQNTVLSAVLTFSDHVLYPTYTSAPRLFGFAALEDQVASGAIMWVLGSMAFVLPAVVIAVKLLGRRSLAASAVPIAKPSRPGRAHAWQAYATLWDRLPARRREAIVFIALFAICGLSFAAVYSGASDDDDQALRFHGVSGPFAVSVFAPSEISAGPASLGVLVQDARTQHVILGSDVEIAASGLGTSKSETVRASHEQSENKLLQAAEVDFSRAGNWNVRVKVTGDADQAEFWFPLVVANQAPGPVSPWMYLIVVAVAAMLAAVHWRRERARKSRIRRSENRQAMVPVQSMGR